MFCLSPRIYLNTTRGVSPTSSPLDSPDQPTTLSVATLDSLSLRRQVRPLVDVASTLATSTDTIVPYIHIPLHGTPPHLRRSAVNANPNQANFDNDAGGH